MESVPSCRIVIDKEPPTFLEKLPKIIATKGTSLLRSLNDIQRKAVLKALAANEYFLIKGLPGTGKTQTLTTIVRLLVLMGKSILITSHTHSAVDNLLMRLKHADDQLKFIRLGSTNRINGALARHSESELTRHCTTPEQLKSIYDSFVRFSLAFSSVFSCNCQKLTDSFSKSSASPAWGHRIHC